MAIPAYMWLKDDNGLDIKGSSEVLHRQGSIEILSFHHNVNVSTDSNTGKLTGSRKHSPMKIEKEFDSASPYLYKAVSTGQRLTSAEIKWYKINASGMEEEYFNMFMEGVKIVSVTPIMHDIKKRKEDGHLENVELMYEKITWKFCKGNLIFTDSWVEPDIFGAISNVISKL